MKLAEKSGHHAKPEDLDKDPKQLEEKRKREEEMENLGKEFTGEGFMDYGDLVKIVKSYQQRTFCEDVEVLKKLGGINALFTKLKTSTTKGIDASTVEQRIKAFGTNKPPEAEVESCFSLFLGALNDLTLIILMIAAVVSIIINMIFEADHRSTAWVEGFAILMAVFICAGVTAINDYQKEKQFRELNEQAIASKTIQVLRDGQKLDVRLSEVVVGDIVTIVAGDEIAGDALLISGSSVLADEASMTGESDALHKEPQDLCEESQDKIVRDGKTNTATVHDVPSPVLLSGTNIKNGTGTMLIITVGPRSAIGKIRATITDKGDDETPLQKKLDKIATQIGYFGLVAAILVLIAMIVRAIIDKYNVGSNIIKAFLVSITVVVVAIPEGLPLAVTLSLAFSVKKMLGEKNLVKKLHACETMGGANVICSDKTGTLTTNQMELTNFWNLEAKQVFDQKSLKVASYTEYIAEPQIKLFLQSTCVNSHADPDEKNGNPTEMGIARYMKKCGVDVVKTRQRYQVLAEEPFSSDRKRTSMLIKDDDGKQLMLIKGASELILETCDSLIDMKSGKISKIGQAEKEEIKVNIEKFASMSLRTIGIGYATGVNYDKTKKDANGVLECESRGITFIGILGIMDVIRPEVPKAVEDCRIAGIEVKMVTGDNKITARAIAKTCGIITTEETGDFAEYQVMLGKDFFDYVGGYTVTKDKDGNSVYSVTNGERFTRIHKHIQVLARSRPEDKLTMVVGLRERGNIVAVTGDGTNDAPSLSKANVGFAMGLAGTEIAKQAAAILLTDDNFTSIISAVKWGRNIYDSIRKFLQFQLTVNVVAVMITFISAIFTKEAVLSAVQMLWVNLIMDTLASLALATEPPTPELLLRKPFPPTASIISKKMTKHILGQAIFQLIIICVFLFAGHLFLPSGLPINPNFALYQEGVRYENQSPAFKALPKMDKFYITNTNPVNSFVRKGLEIQGYEEKEYYPSVHYTYNFNVFVMMQVFNFLNARKLEDEVFILKGIFGSPFYLPIVFGILVLQFIIVTFTGVAFRVSPWGLRVVPWLICVGFGAISLIWRLFILPIPEERICPAFGASATEKSDLNKMSSLSLKRSLSRKSSINRHKGQGLHI